MSRRMTSETIIFDTDWLTEDDFDEEDSVIVSIDYQAYDTLKIITPPGIVLFIGGTFQEFDVYKLENFGAEYQLLLEEGSVSGFGIEYTRDEALTLYLTKSYWENYLEGISSIYIKGVKR